MESKSSCERLWDMLSAYADGEATLDEASLVEVHTATCPDCARDLEFMRLTAVSIKQAPEVSPPSYLRDAILAVTVNRTGWLDRIGFGRVFAPFSRSRVAWSGAALAGIAALAIALRPTTSMPDENRGAAIVSAPVIRPDADTPVTRSIARNREVPPIAPTNLRPSGPGRMMANPRDGLEFASLKIPITTPKSSVVVPRLGDHLSPPPTPKREAVLPAKSDREPDKPAESSDKPIGKSGEPMEIAMATMTDMMKTDKMGGMSDMGVTEAPASAVSPASYRIMLSGSGDAVNARTVATLADIRNRLRNSSVSSNCTLPLVRSNDRRDMTLDIYKGRF